MSLDNVFKYNAVIRLKNGVKLKYGPLMDLSAVPAVVEIWHEQPYTPKNFEIGPQDVVFDLGANVGNFSIYAAQRTAGAVYSFEPVPANFALLSENARLNNADNIVPINAAVTATPGSISLNLSAASTAHSIVKSEYSSGQTITVKSVNLEEFCREQNIGKIDFLKVDCEGAENEIILNLSDAFVNNIDKIVLEYHERFTGLDHGEISRFLAKRGFAVHEDMGQYIYARRAASHDTI